MKFSIIIPVFNAQHYIAKCIDSILDQTVTDWELILVNDGSSDDSFLILQQYQKKDKRIKLFSQNNAGPGPARNLGLRHAQGDYVVFIDSDDYIDRDYLKEVSSYIPKADIVFIDILQVSDDGKVYRNEGLSSCKKWSKDRLIRSHLTGKLPWGGWRRVVKRKLLQQHNIEYVPFANAEEHLFTFRSLYHADNFGFVSNHPIYYYVNRDGSQSKLKIPDPYGDAVRAFADYLHKHNLYSVYANTLNSFNVTATIVSLDRLTNLYRGKTLQQKAKQRMLSFKQTFDTNYQVDWKNLPFKALLFTPFIMVGIYQPILWASILRRWYRGK